MEKCFWCGCEIIGKPNHLKDFGYVCDKEKEIKMSKYEQTEVPLQYKCHVCGITLVYQLGDENFEHICQLCFSQRKERNDRQN